MNDFLLISYLVAAALIGVAGVFAFVSIRRQIGAEIRMRQELSTAMLEVERASTNLVEWARDFTLSSRSSDALPLGQRSTRLGWPGSGKAHPGTYTDQHGDLRGMVEHAAKVGRLKVSQVEPLLLWLDETRAIDSPQSVVTTVASWERVDIVNSIDFESLDVSWISDTWLGHTSNLAERSSLDRDVRGVTALEAPRGSL